MNIQLKCGVALVALCVAQSAHAQQQGEPASAAQSSPLGGTNNPLTASAQSEPAELNQATKAEDSSDIIVTGTLIRGIAPTGTETVTVTAEDIKEAGGLTTNDVLARLPQITNFFNTQIVAAPGQTHGIDTPEIHGLPTLILLDGHRVASAYNPGSGAPSIDPSIIPKGVLQGIEVVPDGGSALYGSDAVGGVINLTTRKRFDGVDIDGNVGFANNYRSYRIDATVGKTWSTGSIYVAYAFDKQTPLYGRDRPYLQYLKPECYPGTVTLSAFSLVTFTNTQIGQYTYPGVTAGGKPTGYTSGQTTCNEYPNETVTEEEHTHSVFAGLSQDLNSDVRMDLRAFYSTRRSMSYNVFDTQASGSVPTTNAFYTPTPPEAGFCLFCSQTVGFSLAPAVGGNLPNPSRLDTWGISNEFTANVGHGFQVRLLGNYSQSYTSSTSYQVDSNLLATSLASGNVATALDPYDVTATPQSAALAREIDDQSTNNTARLQEAQGRLVADGTLFHLPGGDVKTAVGGEVRHDDFAALTTNLTYSGALYSPTQNITGSRTIASAFGELEVPVISADNHVPLVYGLHLSAAGRYDHYSDFGGTFNPRFAASLMPVEWFTVRATYGHSFVAPALSQEYQPQAANVAPGIAFLLPPQDKTDGFANNLIIVTGGNPNLKPQKARTYSLGGDLKIPGFDGFKASITYYNAHYTNQIGVPPFTVPGTFYTPTYAPYYAYPGGGTAVSYATAQSIVGSAPLSGNGFTSLSQMYGPGGTVTASSPVLIANARYLNLGIVNTSGLDFDANYKHPTSFGSVNFDASGNYVLNDQVGPAPGAAFVNQLLLQPRFNGSVSAGVNVGAFRVTADVLHTSGYGLTPSVQYSQLHVKAYDTVNAFASYTFKGRGFMNYLNGAELTLNVTNVFNVKPAINESQSSGYSGGSIIGRTFQIGIHNKF